MATESLRISTLTSRPEPVGKPLLSEFSLELHPGEALLLLDSDGHRASLLLRLLAGLDVPENGHIFLGDLDLTQLGLDQRARFRNRLAAYIPAEELFLPGADVMSNITLGLVPRHWQELDPEWPEVVLSQLDLAPYRDARPTDLPPLERKKVALARALMIRPEILLWDRPWDGLEERARSSFAGLLRTFATRLDLMVLASTGHPPVPEGYASMDLATASPLQEPTE